MLTCCIACSVLNCELQHSGVLQDRGLDYQYSRSEEIGPCLRAISKQVVNNFRIIDFDVAASSAFTQQRQDRSIDSLDMEKAVMDRCGRGFVGICSLQINISVSKSQCTRLGNRTKVFTRKDNIGHAAKSRVAACSSTSLEKMFLETTVAFTSNLPGTRSGPVNFMIACDSM